LKALSKYFEVIGYFDASRGKDAGGGKHMRPRVSRRDFLQVTGGVALTTLLTGCFGVGGEQSLSTGGNGAATITIWDIRTGSKQTLVNKTNAQFNSSHANIHAVIEYFQNDPYKQKIQVAMGAHKPPDIFFSWGGGVLKSYIDAGDVYDLTSALNADPTWKNKFLPSVMSGVTFNGKIYAVPTDGVQPVVFFYNKDVFDQYHLAPAQTWDELLSLVSTLKQHNVIPISVAGQSKWPYLMYEEYLVDRLGGPSVFDAVLANEANAWSHPTFIKANTMLQQLVDAGAFGSNFASVNADTNQDTALLYTGKAAMQLQGGWNFSTVISNNPDFIQQGKLGWFPFPAVEGGSGNVADVAGNLSDFYAIASATKSPQNSITYLKDDVLNADEVAGFIALGTVPPVKGIEAQLSKAKHSDWLQFIYTLARDAPHFQLSWDQALTPQPAQAILTNLDQLFLKQITPQQFSDNMNKAIGS
jgi:raffinose/stachyose/melibiose transport system substrate-binding protein